jgi:hypothetical protein
MILLSRKVHLSIIGALLLSSSVTIVRGAELGTKSIGGGGTMMVDGAESSTAGGGGGGGDHHHIALMGKILPVVSQLFRRR